MSFGREAEVESNAESAAISATESPVMRLGDRVLGAVERLGEFALFCGATFGWLVRRRMYRNTLLPNLFQIGVQSVTVVAITGTFIGMVLAVQAYSQFKLMRLENRLGSVINVALVTELGPVLAATMLAGRVGGAMAAQIGTMKVTEQIDALECLGTSPVHYLVVPRLAACVLLIPVLTVMGDFMGVIGGALVATRVLGIEPYHYWQHSQSFVDLWAIMTGIFKSLIFGAAIALVSCFRGFKSEGGAEGVGQAATEAFVFSFVAILASDFFLGILLNAVRDALFGVKMVSLTS
jgi:phospholipid/cholesterol/gamma-HCH transport system permease protein